MAAAIPVQDRMRSLQMYLKNTGRYTAAVDGKYGSLTQQAILTAMEDGPETFISDHNYYESGQRLNCNPAYIMAFAQVEASGAGFDDHRPKILFEPHRFSKLTQHRYDKTEPDISYQKWGTRPYPKSTEERYTQLLKAVGLDPWAGFQAASYGKFQILGENYSLCRFDTPWSFAFFQAYDEIKQLQTFETFVIATGIIQPLRLGLWESVALQYNGTAADRNNYAAKLEKAAKDCAKRLAA